VTEAEPVAVPLVAVTVASPVLSAVARPDEAFTANTDELELDQVTDAPPMVCPFWSRTTAENWVVSPMASKVAVGGDTVTEVAIGSGPEVPPESESQDISKRPKVRRMIRSRMRALSGGG
jgi:hypothetical protein